MKSKPKKEPTKCEDCAQLKAKIEALQDAGIRLIWAIENFTNDIGGPHHDLDAIDKTKATMRKLTDRIK